MDKKIIKGLIDEKLEVIQEQFSIIKEYEGKIPVIELDLIMVSIRDLYELLLSLQFENTGGVILKPEPKPASSKVKTPPPPVTVHKLVEEVPEAVKEPESEPVEETLPISEPIAPVRLSPNFISMEPVEKEVPVEESQRITLDLFSEASGATLADRLSEGQEKRIADKFQENKIADFRTTIGINEKFLFINELFEGNMRIYDEAIQKLNASTTMAQADLLLLDLKIVYNWDSESPTVKKFVELVRRKF